MEVVHGNFRPGHSTRIEERKPEKFLVVQSSLGRTPLWPFNKEKTPYFKDKTREHPLPSHPILSYPFPQQQTKRPSSSPQKSSRPMKRQKGTKDESQPGLQTSSADAHSVTRNADATEREGG